MFREQKNLMSNNAIFNSKLSQFGQVEIKDLARQKCIGLVVVLN